MRRGFIGAGVGLGLAVAGLSGASAQEPLTLECAQRLAGQRITIAVPNAAGGGFDIYARSLAPELERISGAAVRISNMPGGGGKAALLRVADAAPDDYAILIENAGDVVSELLQDAALGHQPADLRALGAVHVEPETWLGRADLDLMDPAETPLIASVSSVEANLATIGLVAQATGHKVQFISGYEGSGDQIAAVLRGETDFSSKSLGTALRQMKSGDLRVALVLADGPDPALPGVPWLAGDGGLVAQRSAALTPQDRAERAHIAQLAVELSAGARVLFISSRMQAEAQGCLVEATEAALLSAGFRDAAEAQGRPVTPLGAVETEALYTAKVSAYTEAAPLLDVIAQQVRP